MSARKVVVSIAVCIPIALVIGALVVSASPGTEDRTYVGPEKCTLCHQKRHKSWKGSAHATAFDDLLPVEKKMDKCVKCHVTGHGRGGFTSAQETPNLKHVTCESCHGPASAHVKAAGKHIGEESGWDTKIDATPGARCNRCHNQHIDFGARAKRLRKKRESQ